MTAVPVPGTTTVEGTAAAAPAGTRDPAAHRRRRRLTVIVAVVFLVLTVLTYAATTRTSARPLAPDNPRPDGGRAAAQILTDHGVTVHEATSLAAVGTLAGPGTTVLVTDLTLLDPDRRAELVDLGADLVVVGATYAGLDGLGGGVDVSGSGSADPLTARCADPDATAAGEISFSRGSVTGADDVELCFPVGDDAAGYAVWEHEGVTVRYLADPRVMSNEFLADSGNAALTLRVLGRHDTLVWYLPSATDLGGAGDAVPPLPPAVAPVTAVLVAAVVVLGLAQGRALGPVVTEVMPVVVRSAETARGRGRLYRRSGAHAHAAAALRAGTARRVARQVGLPRHAGPAELVGAVAAATGRAPAEVHALLYGPPPTDDGDLLAVSVALDTLESEVHRS